MLSFLVRLVSLLELQIIVYFFHVFPVNIVIANINTVVYNSEIAAWHVCFGVVVRVMRMKVEIGIENLMLAKKNYLGVKKARKIRRRKARGKIRMECNNPRRKSK